MEWQELCDRLAQLGTDLDDEGTRHLANQVACWLTYALGHDDPRHPSLFRSSDPVYQWGGPNADQVARRARVAGDGIYRLRGHMGSCEEFVLQVKAGSSQSGGASVATEIAASDLGFGPGDEIDIHLGGSPRDGAWIPLDPDAGFIHIRDYYFDWQPTAPATFVLERLDTQGLPRIPVEPGTMLDDAFAEIEHSMRFWSGYQERMLGDQAVNSFGTPAPAARGVQDILYAHSGVALATDEALVVDLDAGGAARWDIQLYNRPWYEALDFANRVTSLNHRLVGPGPIVIAASDPGGLNWLDTEGRDEVLCTIRWWRPGRAPAVSAYVTTLDALDLPAVDRRAQIAKRAAHVAWRYRT